MKQAYVDSNVIIRFITDDPPDMATQAAALFQQVDDGSLQLVVDSISVAESVWVLSSFYGFSPSQIAPILSAFLSNDGIVAADKDELLSALALYQEKNVDFADALLAIRMMKSGIPDVYSFDRHFDRIENVTRIDPGGVKK